MPLTDVKCRNAKAKLKPYKLSDGGGLHLLVTKDGAKYWRLAYRWHGKQRTLALGVYPAVGLTEARAAREDAKRNLAANTDPSTVKRDRKRAAKMAADNNFETVAREWHENWRDGRTPYYAGQILRRMEADIFPAIGRRPIAELEPAELLDMLRKVEKRGVNETARRLKQLVGQIFRFAIVTGRARRDPSADLKDALRATGEPIMFQKALHRVRFLAQSYDSRLFVQYLKFADEAGFLKSYFTGSGIKHFTGDALHSFLVPVPPVAEQAAIVARVEALITTCRSLEEQIERCRDHAADLLQAVLKDTFAPVQEGKSNVVSGRELEGVSDFSSASTR